MDEKDLLKKANELFDIKDYDNVISLIDQNKNIIIKHYHALNILYIKSLFEKEEYEKVFQMTEEELSMPYVPLEYEGIYESLYKDAISEITPDIQKNNALSEDQIKQSLSARPLKEDAMISIINLKDKNIRNYLTEIRNLLKDSTVNNMYKMLILINLKMQEVSLDLEFSSPTATKIINSLEYTCPIEKEYEILDKACEIINATNKDYNFKECAKAMATGILISLMPIDVDKEDIKELAAAGYYKACQMLSVPIDFEIIIEKFPGVDLDKVTFYTDVNLE